ncbi:hypothetical protein OQA88_11337 [Cercophora sp. LCS_1]
MEQRQRLQSDSSEAGSEARNGWQGIHMEAANQSVVTGTVNNAQDLRFESKGAGGPGGQSIYAGHVAIEGDVTYKTRNVYYNSVTSSNPKEAFSESPLKFHLKQHEYLEKAKESQTKGSPNPGTWLFKIKRYIKWRDHSVRKLWIRGNYGAGKTILSSIIIDDLVRRYSTNRNFSCIYVYFDYREQRQQTYQHLLSSLLAQLLRLRDDVSPETKMIHKDWMANGIPPGPDEYIGMLKAEIKTFTRVFIVVDALDEALDGPPEHTMTNFVKALNQLPTNTHILYTSRPLDTIAGVITADKDILITPKDTDGDLRSYFKNQVEKSMALKRRVDEGNQKDPQFFAKAIDAFVEKSQGVFLLAEIHIKSLATKQNLEQLEKGIEELPTQLKEVYKKAWEQIEDQADEQRQTAIKVLTWLIYAERALLLDELMHALTVDESDRALQEKRLLAAEDISSVCAGIVLVNKENKTVNLTHYTAKEYFRQIPSISDEVQSYLAQTCLTYLSFDEFSTPSKSIGEREERLRRYPFLQYATNHWGDHVCRRVRGKRYQQAWEFLNNTEKLQSAFQVMKDFPFQQDSNVTGLHIAAYFGLTRAVEKGFKIRNGGQLAFNAKTRTFLQLLVDQGADLNLADPIRHQTALHIAVKNRDMESVNVLLGSGRCGLDLPDAHKWSPLRWASACGHVRLVEALLEHNARVDAKDADGWTALRWAIQRGHMRVAETLIKQKAVIDTPMDGDQWNLLQRAASEGLLELLRLLIDRGVDLNAVDQKGRTALHLAVRYRRNMVAWLLLQNGASIEKADKRGFTPLHTAVETCKAGGDRNASSLLWMLLEHWPGGITVKTKHGWTVLHIAAREGNSSVVWLLLEKGAGPKDSDHDGSTALHHAATSNHIGVAHLLSTRGGLKLVRAVDSSKKTALHVAASEGHLPMVRMLLDSEAWINAEDGEKYTPLHRAVQHHRRDVVLCLLERGADVNAPNRAKKTALHSAMDVPDLEIIRAMLMSPNADLYVEDQGGRTPLDVAKNRGLDLKDLMGKKWEP